MPRRGGWLAKGCYQDGIYFPSKLENERYNQNLLRQQAGEIFELKVHPRFLLQEAFIDEETGKKINKIEYEADFSYYTKKTAGFLIVEDVKGQPETDVFKLKFKLFRKRYPSIKFRIVTKKDM